MGWGVKVSIKERRERDRKERGRDKTREASGRSKWVPVDVRSGSDGGPDSVISEYGLASYFTHTHTHASHLSSRLDSTSRGLHLAALFVAVSQPADKSSPKDPCLNPPPITKGPALS